MISRVLDNEFVENISVLNKWVERSAVRKLLISNCLICLVREMLLYQGKFGEFLKVCGESVFTYNLTRVLLVAAVLHSVSTGASSAWDLGKSGKQNNMKFYNIPILLL